MDDKCPRCQSENIQGMSTHTANSPDKRIFIARHLYFCNNCRTFFNDVWQHRNVIELLTEDKNITERLLPQPWDGE